jgi:hypothetical protein
MNSKLIPISSSFFFRSVYLTIGICFTSLVSVTQLSAKTIAQYLSPVPGSVYVSPQSNIVVRMNQQLARSLASDPSLFSVQGSNSGTIAGRIMLSDDEKTLVFLPAKNFLAGEKITVAMKDGLRSLSGDELAPVHFDFIVSPLSAHEKAALDQVAMKLYYQPSLPPGGLRGTSPVLRKNSDDQYPPSLPIPTVKTIDAPAPGSIFLNPWKVVLVNNALSYVPSESQYLFILDGNSQPMFYRQMQSTTFDLKLLPNGTLSYFDGNMSQYYVLDNTYAVIDSFECGNGYKTDPHDVRLLPNGHIILVGLDPQEINMSLIVPGGDPVAKVIGWVIQELDLARNVVFEWRSFDHFQITDATHEDLTAATIDYGHPNALEIDADTNILLSDRHMDEITKIDRNTGDIIWRWGGKHNEFTLLGDTLWFSHQHSINRLADGHFTLFDNGNFRTPEYSRAVEYHLDQQAKTATLVWQYRHTPDVYTFAMGSVERLPNGNTFIGWGASNLAATEVRPDGSTAYEIQFPDSIISYRAFKFLWNGVTSIAQTPSVPGSFTLEQNYPNPFNPSTVIRFALSEQSFITLKVYDILGNEVRTVVNENMKAGAYAYTFQANGLASGVYLYRITAATGNNAATRVFTNTKKFVLLK